MNGSVDGEKNEDEFEAIDKYAVATEMIVETKHFDLMVLNERAHRCHFERKGDRDEEIDIGIVEGEVNDHSTRQLIEPILGAQFFQKRLPFLERATQGDHVTAALVGFVDRCQRTALCPDTTLQCQGSHRCLMFASSPAESDDH